MVGLIVNLILAINGTCRVDLQFLVRNLSNCFRFCKVVSSISMYFNFFL